MKKGLKIGCLSIVGLFVLIVLYVIFEPESWRKARIDKFIADKDSAVFYVKEVTKRMAKVKAILPELTEESDELPFPTGKLDWNETLQTGFDEVSNFSDASYYLKGPLRYGPWLTASLESIEGFYDSAKYRDFIQEADYGRAIMKMKFLMVYKLLHHVQPRVIDDKTFQPGYFYGWMIYVDMVNPKVLGYAKMYFHTTLYKIEYKKIGVGIDPLPVSVPLFNTTDVKQKLLDNFREQFFSKSDSVYNLFKSK